MHAPLRLGRDKSRSGQDLLDEADGVDSLRILSFNIEGFLSNNVYLQNLSEHFDIIMLQEHWLHSRDKYRIHDDFNLFNSYTKCFDDDKFDIPIQRSRGHAGVSIMYRKRLQPIIKQISDG